ncbi:hypothetical protein ACFL1N_08990, partial [Thermodesulfobacteriota bacterium]
VFYLIVGMFFSAFFRSEITGAMATIALFAILLPINGWVVPFFNPLIEEMDSAQQFARILQNRILFIILIGAFTLLTFLRVERREKMLGD